MAHKQKKFEKEKFSGGTLSEMQAKLDDAIERIEVLENQ